MDLLAGKQYSDMIEQQERAERAIEDARNSELAYDFAEQLDPETAQTFIARMISTAALDDKHADIDDMIKEFKKWMK